MLTEIEIAQLRELVPNDVIVTNLADPLQCDLKKSTFIGEKFYTLNEIINKIRFMFSIKDESILSNPHHILLYEVETYYYLICLERERSEKMHVVLSNISLSERYKLIEQMYIIHQRFKNAGLSVYFTKVQLNINKWIIKIPRCNIGKGYRLIDTIHQLNSFPLTTVFNEVAIYDSMNPIYNCLLWRKLHPLFAAVAARQTRLTYDAVWLIGQYIQLKSSTSSNFPS